LNCAFAIFATCSASAKTTRANQVRSLIMLPPSPVSPQSAGPWKDAPPKEDALAADGIITLRSAHGPEETMNRLEAAIKAKGLCVFARIDHAAPSKVARLPLMPTDLLIFGSAEVATPLMQSAQTVGLDLPWKALVWQDALGATWLSYNDPEWLGRRHRLDSRAKATIKAMAGALKAIGTVAIAP
jgi:uncharacterized protein (DUF302 family)